MNPTSTVLPRFYFSTCQMGAEKAVKLEILNEFPHLRFAFSRPGFITFKEEDNRKPVIQSTKSIFTRLWGEVLGQVKTHEALDELLTQIPVGSVVRVFERDLYVPGDEPEDYRRDEKITAIVSGAGVAKAGAPIYDIMWIDDFHIFLGKHTHTEKLDVAAGNIPQIKLPAHAPSRAYLKIEEAIHRYRPKIEPGMTVLEVGCSPGGATTAMIARGLLVTGVDPKFMHKNLSQEPKFHFIQKVAKEITPADLKDINPDWIVLDMNIAPLEAIDELAHVIQCLRKNFKNNLRVQHGFLTLKLNDWKFAESIPLYLKRLEECGFKILTATQLCSNRQEFFVYAGWKS